MADDSLVKRINYEYPFFENYLEPNGALKLNPACHACFYYGMLAAKALNMIGESNESQVLVYKVGETPPEWMEANLGNIARGVATMYALESPEVFLKYRAEAWAQAKMLGVEIPEYVFRVAPDTVIKH